MSLTQFLERENTEAFMREPEVCKECGLTFSSLYPLEFCHDHSELEEV